MAKRAMPLIPRSRIWDLEYDIYCHLQDKIKLLASATDEKFNYFTALLEEFHVQDTDNTAQEHAQFMDGLYSTVSIQMHNLPEPSIDDTAEAEEEQDGDDDDGGVVEDHLYKLFMDHLRPDGKFYVLQITEGSVFVRYHHHEESSSTQEALAVCVTENANHVSNDGMHAEYEGKSRGRKPKGSRKIAVRNSNGSGNCVASPSEPQNHGDDGNNDNKKRKRGRPRKHDAYFANKTHGNTIDHRANDDGIATEVKEEIKDYVDVDDVQEPVVNVEYFWHDDKANARKVSDYREKLMQELEKPYCEEEYEKLFKEITCRKPVQHHKELRNGSITYEEDYLGKSFLDHNIDLSRKIDKVRDDHRRVLNLLRGFFYWLKNCSDEDAFMPWRDSYISDVMPQL